MLIVPVRAKAQCLSDEDASVSSTDEAASTVPRRTFLVRPRDDDDEDEPKRRGATSYGQGSTACSTANGRSGAKRREITIGETLLITKNQHVVCVAGSVARSSISLIEDCPGRTLAGSAIWRNLEAGAGPFHLSLKYLIAKFGRELD